jgi:acetoin utilization deacetylase AcuC-like enzyme
MQGDFVMTASEKEKTAIIYNEAHVNHKPSTTSSPENPERLVNTIKFLRNETKVFDESTILFSDFEPAKEQDALLVHEMRYINFIKEYCKRGGGFLGDSTYLTKAT